MKKSDMNGEREDFEKIKEGSLTPEDKESSGFKKILDEQEDSSLSSNDYGGSNEVISTILKYLNWIWNSDKLVQTFT